MTYQTTDPLTIARVLAFVKPILQSATSEDELKRRLAKQGFGFRDTIKGRMLTTMPHGVEITRLPVRTIAL